MLEITMFGSGGLKYGEKKLAGFPNQVPYFLLCYLLLNRQHPHNREALAAVFWGDYSLASSRKMLRNTLWRLRQALSTAGIPLDTYFRLEEDGICFLCTSPYYLDIEAFENVATHFQDMPGQSLTISQASALESAAALYKGDLLTGIYEDWCLYDRERLRLLYQGLLCKLMVYAGVNGFYEQGIHHGLRLLNMDITWEKIHRQLMWLYWLSGDCGSALAQYKLCQQILREELSASPTPETQHQYELMLHNHFDPQMCFIEGTQNPLVDKGKEKGALQTVGSLQQELHRLKDMIDAARAKSDLIESLINDALNS